MTSIWTSSCAWLLFPPHRLTHIFRPAGRSAPGEDGSRTCSVLLSIDAAVIHACYLSGPTLTGILRLDVARALIAAVGRDCRIVAIHLIGWAAGAAASEVTSAAACDLLLHAMDAARPVGRA